MSLSISSVQASERTWRKCTEFMQELAEAHRESIGDIEATFEARWNRVLAEVPEGKTARKELSAMAKRLRQNSGLTASQHTNVTRVLDLLDHMPITENDLEYCRNKRFFRNRIETFALAYEEEGDQLLAELEALASLFSLKPDEGVLIIAGHIDGSVESIKLDQDGRLGKALLVGPYRNEEFFTLAKVQAGPHHWDHMRSGMWELNLSFLDTTLDIQAGALNYAGVLSLSMNFSLASAQLDDRAAIVLDKMEVRYPELLRSLPMFNALTPDDPFIEFYLREKAQQNESSANAP
ncbi:MAG: hypothetical protein AAGH19_03020 [Pseudomonadota bacterium]